MALQRDLFDYYQTNFDLMERFKWSLSEIENMMPFELEVYVGLLRKHINEKQKENG